MGQTHLPKELVVSSKDTHEDDEIDLKELLLALWGGRYIIISIVVICVSVAVSYALLAKQVWTAEAVVTVPQASDFSNYRQLVSDLQPAFDVYQDDGTVLVSEKLNDFTKPDTLLKIFIQQFESRDNKRSYIANVADFQKEIKHILSAGRSREDYKDSEAALYNKWYQKLSAKPVKSDEESQDSYTLQGIQETSEESYDFLNGYVQFVSQKARLIALSNVRSDLENKLSELSQLKSMLMDQAKSRLLNEQTQTKYALDIAKAAGINKPQQNLDNQELFSINIGANALAAKVKALDGLKELSVIEPRLPQIDAKLRLLGRLNVASNIDFKTFQYVESPEAPINRTAPKRALIAILGALLGCMLGCAIVLVRHAFREK